MTEDKTIVLYTFNDMLEATLAQDKLTENGIESFLQNENVLGLGLVGGVELSIFEKDAEAAAKLLQVK
jgi:hypothetical protein